MRRPISRVRSVTETSMMFMIPTPPTTSEMAATTISKIPIISDVCADGVEDLGQIENLEIVVLRRRGDDAARGAAR